MKTGLWIIRKVAGGMLEGCDMTCAARKQGTAGGNEPVDCNFPLCGCDVPAYHELERVVPHGEKCFSCPKSEPSGITDVYCHLLEAEMPGAYKACGVNGEAQFRSD